MSASVRCGATGGQRQHLLRYNLGSGLALRLHDTIIIGRRICRLGGRLAQLHGPTLNRDAHATPSGEYIEVAR